MEFFQTPQAISQTTPRPEVEKMQGYKAPLEGRRNLLRLDFNENTIGPSPHVVEALRRIPRNHISIYPEYSGLREAVAISLNSREGASSIKSTQVGIFNGVDAAIHAIFHAYGDRGDQLLTTTPTFGYYTPCAQMQGMEIQAIPYEGQDFNFPIQQIQRVLIEKKTKLLLICNPNNPTGTRVSPQKIIDFATSTPNTLVVVDELYEAFTGDSVLPKVDFDKTPNLVVLRSLSKTAGLAGLRIGFAIGTIDVVNRISRVTGPYDVNSFAVIAALAALEDQAYVDAYVEEVLQAKDWINCQLKHSRRRYHLDGGNYLLIWPNQASLGVEASLKEAGILVRNMKGKPLIDGALRVSIGTTDQMQQFWEAFSNIDFIKVQ